VASGSVRTDIVSNGNDVRPATAAEVGLSRKAIFEARQLRDAERDDPGIVRRLLDAMLDRGGEPTRAELRRSFRTSGTGDNEWFTPVEYVDRVCAVLGEIDLDPASHPLAQERINAKRFFTKEDDGLKHDWDKIVFCNPPYGRGQIDAFVAKLIDELSAGRVKQANLLTNNSSETDWFLRAGKACAAICFTLGRVRFYNAGRPDDDAPLQGQAFFYFGDDPERFAKVFGEVGLVFPKPMAFP
jgi:hypothetical protein